MSRSEIFFHYSRYRWNIYAKHLLLTILHKRPSNRHKMIDVNDNNNNTNTELIQWIPGLQLSACIFYSLILLFGVTGNILVIVIVIKYRDMRNATNLLLTNLSVADLFLLLFCTADGYQHLYGKDKHRLGNFMCM